MKCCSLRLFKDIGIAHHHDCTITLVNKHAGYCGAPIRNTARCVFSMIGGFPRFVHCASTHCPNTNNLVCARRVGVGWTSTPAVPGRVVARMPLPARAGVSQVGTWAGLQLQWRTGLQRLECPFPREPGLVRLVLGLDFNSSDTEMCRGSIPPLRRVSNPTQ